MEAIDRGGMATSRQPAALALPAPLSVGRTIALWPGLVRRLAQRLNMRLRVVASVEESARFTRVDRELDELDRVRAAIASYSER